MSSVHENKCFISSRETYFFFTVQSNDKFTMLLDLITYDMVHGEAHVCGFVLRVKEVHFAGKYNIHARRMRLGISVIWTGLSHLDGITELF